MSSHMGPISPKETTSTHYMMLHSGLFPRLTIEVVPQGLYTIMPLKAGKHIYDGDTKTYNDDIHQNIFQSYKCINNI